MTERPHRRELDQVFTRAEALAAGTTPGQLRQRLRSGKWLRLRRGAYCLATTWEQADARRRHVLAAQAALKTLGYAAWASHVTAAAVLRLPAPTSSVRCT